MERARFVLVFAAAMGTATMGGILYGFSSFVMRALGKIPPEHGIAAMNSMSVVIITPSFMLVFAGTGLLCVLLGIGTIFERSLPGTKLVLLASLLYVGGVVGLTMAVNQPMNLRLGAMPPAQARSYWPDYLSEWTRWNHVRTVAALLACALFIAALVSIRTSPGPAS